MKRTNAWTTWIATVSLVLSAGWAGPVAAEDDTSGLGVAQSKSLASSTVTITDIGVLRVTARTQIQDRAGQRIPLAQVTTLADGGDIEPGEALYEYRFVDGAGGRILELLRAAVPPN